MTRYHAPPFSRDLAAIETNTAAAPTEPEHETPEPERDRVVSLTRVLLTSDGGRLRECFGMSPDELPQVGRR
jgi:hypothetical protein